VADDDDETIDAADPSAEDDEDDDRDEAEDDDGAPSAAARRRRGLDGRTLAICALIAFIAAGVVFFGLTALGVGTDDGDAEAGQGTLTPAEELPDIVLPRLGGGDEVRLSDFRGQPLIVNFWGSWCDPCVDEMPAFQRVHQSLGDQVAFLGVNVNDTLERATIMVEETGVTYDLARDEGGALGRALDISTFPTTVLILPDGTIAETVYREMSAERLCEKVNQSLLNQSLGEGDCG
jgi:thiol-disulfide isomerase/thioredoxin